MTNNSELFIDGVLNLIEAKKRIFENIISQNPNHFSGRLIEILFPRCASFYDKKHVLYIPEYKLKVSFPARKEESLEVEVVAVPDKDWKVAHIDLPIFTRRSGSTFCVINGVLHLCFYSDFQTIKEDLSIKIGNECDSAIKIDIVNRKYECINYDGEGTPVDLLDAYSRMSDGGYFFTNVADIHHEVSLERKKNEEFDKACESCCIYDMLSQRSIYDTLFLLNAYMVSPIEVACLYENDYGSTVLAGFVQACAFDSLCEPGDVMAAFKQLFGKGNTAEEILGMTEDEILRSWIYKPRTKDKTSLSWVRFIQEKKGLQIQPRNF